MDLARARFEQASEADKEQRERELEDLRFYAGDQWPADVKQAREGQSASNELPAVPARPCLTINKVRGPVRQVLNEERQIDLGVEIVAADDFGELVETDPNDANHAEIELREGLVRRIQRQSEASDARNWAGERAAIAGRGYYGILTRYLPGKSFDKEIYVHRFYNQASVSLDPSHEQPDGSDAEFGFVGTDLSWDRYKADHPKDAKGARNDIADADDDTFRALGEEQPKWFKGEGPKRTVRVVEYWYKVHKARTLVLYSDGSTLWAEEAAPQGAREVDRRDVDQIVVKWAKIDGKQKLEETEWECPHVPIIKVLGEELQPYDNERRAEGIVRPARDSQQGFNAMVSKWVEAVGLAPIPPFQVTPEQVQGWEEWYQAANTRTLPYLPHNRIDTTDGSVLDPPTRTPVDTPVTAIAGSIQVFNEALQATTQVPDPAIGRQDPSVKSGKMALALIAQAQHGTSNYLDNLKRSIRYEGQIINDLLYPTYGKRPGRLVRMVMGDGEPRTVRISPAPNGQAAPGLEQQPANPQQPGAPPLPPVAMPAAPAPQKPYVLTPDASFNVVIKVTPSSDTRRTQETSIIAELLSANPALMLWFGDLFFKNQDGPGHLEMAERAKVMLDPKILALIAAKQPGGQQIPPAVAAQLEQFKERIQRAEQIMQAQAQELATKAAEGRTKIEIEKVNADKDVFLQRMKDATTIAVAKINALVKGVQMDNEAAVEAVALAHEADQNALQRQHEQGQTAITLAHQAAVGQVGQDAAAEQQQAQQAHELNVGQQGHEQTLEQQQQAADLAPPPATGTGDEGTGS